jgi:5-methyltetrahydrofolate--homocysteine methyltransferase
MADHMESIKNAVIGGKHAEIKGLVQQALDAGLNPNAIINDALIAAMDVVGKDFGSGKIFVPEMLVSAVTMKTGLEVVKPRLAGGESQTRGTIIMATVKGDLHDIGKNLVCMMLEGASFEIIDLGTDVSPEKFVDAVENKGANFIAMSALLTTTMPNMKTTIEALKQAGLRDKVKVMIGGAPVTSKYAEDIGADGYAPDASKAVSLAKSLVA